MKPDSILMLDFAWLSSPIMPPPVSGQADEKTWLCSLLVKVKGTVFSDYEVHGIYTVHGILQARILEWVAFLFSRGSSQPGIEPRSPTVQANSSSAEPQWEIQTVQLPVHDHIWEASS